MPIPVVFNQSGLMPAKYPDLAAAASVGLPVGGPVGVGGGFAQGLALGLIGGTAQSQVNTLTMTLGGATGFKGYFIYYADKVYSGLSALVTGGITANLVSAYPTAAQLQTALIAAVPQWSGNVTVTGSSSGPFTITYNTLMANRMIGGLLQFNVTASTGGTPTGAITVATTGSCGAGQYAPYASGGTPNRVDAALKYFTLLDPAGCQTGFGLGLGGTGDPADGYPAYTRGFFYADTTNYPEKSIVGLDANAFTVSPYKLVFGDAGLALTDVGVMVQLR